jgi:GDP-L-fucose synthase
LIPITENQLLTGKLEVTNEPYAISKIAGIKLAESYRLQYGLNVISLMPTNLYGPGDNFDPQNSHVLPALIQRFHKAKVENVKEVTCWGDGSPLREFLYVEDLADAAIFCMQNYNEIEFINVGTGVDISIKDLAELISEIIGYKGSILWDKSNPNGTHQKTLDVTKLTNLGWTPKTELSEGIRRTYEWFLSNFEL